MSMVLAIVSMAWAQDEVTFDFENNTYGLEKPTGTTPAYVKSGTLTEEPATLTMSVKSGNGFAYFTGLRVYRVNKSTAGDATLTAKVADAKITKIVMNVDGAFTNVYFNSTEFTASNNVYTWSNAEGVDEVAINFKTKVNKTIKSLVITYIPAGDPSLLPANIAFTPNSYTIDFGDEFTAPVPTKDTDAPLTYSSSNTEVAEVNETSGAVTIKGAGTTTITAKAVATETHKAGSASYTLTVVAAALNFSDIEASGETPIKVKFPMTVTYINGNHVYVTADNEVAYFYNQKGVILPTLNAGDVIPAGWTASYTVYNGLSEFIFQTAPAADTETAALAVEEVERIGLDDMSRIVILKNVKFTEATLGDTSANFDGTVYGGETYAFRNTYKIASVEAGVYNVKCAVSYYERNLKTVGTDPSKIQLIPIEYQAIPAPEVEYKWEATNNKKEVTVTLTISNGVIGDIYYKFEEEASPSIPDPESDRAQVPAEGYTKYDVPFTVENAGTLSYYAEGLNAATSEVKTESITNDQLTTGVENIIINAEAAAEYFDLQGRRVANPTNGLYLRRTGNTVTKVIL